MVVSSSTPMDRTVLTDTWTMIGADLSTAAATTARRLRSSRMFTAATA